MADSKAVEAALRVQIEAMERFDEESKQRLAKLGLEPATPEEEARYRKLWEDSGDSFSLGPQLEGFVAGWLAATGQLEQYGDLLQIWLDTPKRICEPELVDVTGMIARIATPHGWRHV